MNYFWELFDEDDKKRFIDRKYNLDLSYITPRIIVMSYPTSRPKTFFGDYIKTAIEFLNERYDKDYLLINLDNEDKDFNFSKFNGKFLKYKIIFNMPPMLVTLFSICDEINNYLNKNLSNVVAINCQGGNGDLGIVVCSYLLYIKKFNEIKDSFNYYSKKRLNKGEGISIPGQKKYVEYFHKLIKNEKNYFPFRIKIISIEIKNMYEVFNGGYYFVEILDFKDKKKNKEIEISPKNYKVDDINKSVILNLRKTFNQELFGDIAFKISYKENVFTKKLGKISFNTAFLNNSDQIIFNANEIFSDNILKSKKIPLNYAIQINIQKLCVSCPSKEEKDYCQECKTFILKNKEIYDNWRKIMNYLNEYKSKKITYDKNILFGSIDSDDCEYVLANEEKNKSDKNLMRNESKFNKNDENDKNYYEDNNDSNSSEESYGEDYEEKYENNEENKKKDKLNDSFESECFIY